VKRQVAYSISLHIALLACAFLTPTTTPPISRNVSSIQVESLTQKEFNKRVKQALNKKEKQLVQIDEKIKSESPPDENNGQRVFYSSKNQRADHNTRARKIGEFKNVLKEGNPNSASNKLSKLFEIKEEEKKEDAATAPKNTGQLRSPASQGPEGEGVSATDDYLEDVAIGAHTILNANEYRFYGFYSRIREKLIQRWHQTLKLEIQKLENEGRPIVNTQRKTQVRVFLNAAGDIQNTQLLGSSGLVELDRAATDAFKLAAPFPHPPREMIDEDGLVPIRWEFVVVSSSDSGVQFSVQRTGYR